MIIDLKNDCLRVRINTQGAEVTSITDAAGREFIWQADQNVWGWHAPLLFPITGRLRDDKFIFEEKEYTLKQHGYARFCEFEPKVVSETQAVFLLCSDEESLKCYPYSYELRVIYTLAGNTLEIKYVIKNKSGGTMYVSIGSHEGYSCPEGIEEYSIIFERKETLDSCVFNDGLIEYKTFRILEDEKELPLTYEYFKNQALVFKNLISRSLLLKHNKSGKQVRIDFNGFDYLILWTKPDARYICIEPWTGINDPVDSDFDITKKEGIEKMRPGAISEYIHAITING